MTAEAWFLLAAFVVLQGVFILVLRAGRRRIAELDRQLLTALGIITEKNDALREYEAANTALHDRNERLHNDLAAMRERLPRVQLVQPWTRNDAPAAADPDPTRPCIPTYEAGEGEQR